MVAMAQDTVNHVEQMSEETSWKERVRRAVSDASRARLAPVMAQETGIPGTRINKFVSSGYLNSDMVKQLEEWLIRNGRLGSGPVQSDVNDLLATELEALAAIIRSSAYPQEIKSDRFVAAVRGWHKAVDAYTAMLKESH